MKKFKELSKGKKAIVIILGILALPLTLLLLSLISLFKNVKNKKIGKSIISCILVFITSAFAYGAYCVETTETTNQENQLQSNKPEQDNKEDKENSSPKKETEVSVEETVIKEEVQKEKTKVSDEEAMIKIAKKIAGDKFIELNYNEDIDTVIVKLELGDNFTNGFIIKGGYMNAEKIIKAINEKYDNVSTYDFWFVMDLVDAYGNESKDKVLSFDYDDETIEKINWDNMYTDKFMELANNEWVHPVLRD